MRLESHSFVQLISDFKSISEQNLQYLSVEFENIIELNCKDENHIETLLDRLLDICFDDNALILYKKLCRYYLDINPQATKDYIDYYFKMYKK